MTDYMRELSQSLGLTHYPGRGPFGTKEGTVVGARDGYLVAVGPAREGRATVIRILLRFKVMDRPEQVRAAIRSRKLRVLSTNVKVEKSFAVLTWPYVFRRPKSQEVSELLRTLIESLKSLAPGLDGHCEKCQSAANQVILLRDGVPGYYCDGCQQRIRQELEAAGVILGSIAVRVKGLGGNAVWPPGWVGWPSSSAPRSELKPDL